MSDQPADAALPPGHVPTVRVATPNPRDAKRHIRTRSGWPRDYMTACVVRLPMDCCETGSAPVEDIECPRCRETPEFARAVEEAGYPGTVPRSSEHTAQVAPRRAPRTTQPTTPAPPGRKPTKSAGKPATSPQGSLF